MLPTRRSAASAALRLAVASRSLISGSSDSSYGEDAWQQLQTEPMACAAERAATGRAAPGGPQCAAADAPMFFEFTTWQGGFCIITTWVSNHTTAKRVSEPPRTTRDIEAAMAPSSRTKSQNLKRRPATASASHLATHPSPCTALARQSLDGASMSPLRRRIRLRLSLASVLHRLHSRHPPPPPRPPPHPSSPRAPSDLSELPQAARRAHAYCSCMRASPATSASRAAASCRCCMRCALNCCAKPAISEAIACWHAAAAAADDA